MKRIQSIVLLKISYFCFSLAAYADVAPIPKPIKVPESNEEILFLGIPVVVMVFIAAIIIYHIRKNNKKDLKNEINYINSKNTK